jgi:hypothetical protein
MPADSMIAAAENRDFCTTHRRTLMAGYLNLASCGRRCRPELMERQGVDRYFCLWHETDLPTGADNVRCSG